MKIIRNVAVEIVVDKKDSTLGCFIRDNDMKKESYLDETCQFFTEDCTCSLFRDERGNGMKPAPSGDDRWAFVRVPPCAQIKRSRSSN